MKVAIYQTSPVLFDLEANLEDVITKIHEGRGKGANLIVFPELALTGYFLGQRSGGWRLLREGLRPSWGSSRSLPR